MYRLPLRWVLLCGVTAATFLLAGSDGTLEDAAAAASWRDLNGRVAPDLVFQETALGLPAGTRLSSYRGKEVVLLAFWLRDCPHCKRELPKVQRLHDLYGRSGLSVISICHGFELDEVTPTMAKRAWTFPVARDAKGQMAASYGGGRRPGFYVVGIDGRVKASNSLSDRVIRTELGRWRLAELGTVPAELKAARESVYAGDYGAALRAAEAVGRRAGASAEVRAAVARLTTIAGRKLQNRVDRAEAWHKAGHEQRASQEYRGIVATFLGTSLETRAKALAKNYESRARGS
jgi:peroxiredoxin